jgi:hypothetical protein
MSSDFVRALVRKKGKERRIKAVAKIKYFKRAGNQPVIKSIRIGDGPVMTVKKCSWFDDRYIVSSLAPKGSNGKKNNQSQEEYVVELILDQQADILVPDGQYEVSGVKVEVKDGCMEYMGTKITLRQPKVSKKGWKCVCNFSTRKSGAKLPSRVTLIKSG